MSRNSGRAIVQPPDIKVSCADWRTTGAWSGIAIRLHIVLACMLDTGTGYEMRFYSFTQSFTQDRDINFPLLTILSPYCLLLSSSYLQERRIPSTPSKHLSNSSVVSEYSPLSSYCSALVTQNHCLLSCPG